ncbi:uncharacterized protein LOC144355674 [Saccoglossus kowalevskii]
MSLISTVKLVRHTFQVTRYISSINVPTESGFKFTDCLRRDTSMNTRIYGRQWLPGSSFVRNKLPKYLAAPRKNRPAVYEATAEGLRVEDIDVWALKARSIIEEKLHIFGTILFTGLPLKNATDFSKFFKFLGYQPTSYVGGVGSRHQIADNILTANDNDPPIYSIEPHNEMSYTNHYPQKIFFFCDVPAQCSNGGQSIVCDVREILPKLDPKVVEKFDSLGVRYWNYLTANSHGNFRGLHDTFDTDDRIVIERFLEANQWEYNWEEDGSLSYWYTLSAFTVHPKTDNVVSSETEKNTENIESLPSSPPISRPQRHCKPAKYLEDYVT